VSKLSAPNLQVKDNRNRNPTPVAESKDIRRATLTCKSGGLALSESIPTSPQSLSLLKAKEYFPFFYAVVKTLSGRWGRRVFLTILLLLMVISTASRLHVEGSDSRKKFRIVEKCSVSANIPFAYGSNSTDRQIKCGPRQK